jgi:hypothetical protein
VEEAWAFSSGELQEDQHTQSKHQYAKKVQHCKDDVLRYCTTNLQWTFQDMPYASHMPVDIWSR